MTTDPKGLTRTPPFTEKSPFTLVGVNLSWSFATNALVNPQRRLLQSLHFTTCSLPLSRRRSSVLPSLSLVAHRGSNMSPYNQYRGRGRSRARGRGAHFAAKYGNRSQNSQNLSSCEERSRSYSADVPFPSTVHGDLNELSSFLKKINGTSYPSYKRLRGAWQVSSSLLLIFDHIQGDAFAAPSRARLRVPLSTTEFDPLLYSNSIRTTAFCDYLTRKFSHFSHVARLDYKPVAHGWASAKGGNIAIDTPGQHVLSRTSCIIDGDVLELRITVALPARGRTVEGRVADEALTQILPIVAEKVLYAQSDDASQCAAHVVCVEEQEELRNKLSDLGLIAFVIDGAILPREAGDSDKPMQEEPIVRFKSPDSLSVNVNLSTGRTLQGMGIRAGISLIVGGGFHGKSTLLRALQVGVYNHVPGDGREFVCVIPQTVSIRSEDGRFIVGVDITPFINNLPYERDSAQFSTKDASGSTSQAANIVEAIDAGAKLFLIDEDLSATNFMIRDARMRQLVPAGKEPITPMTQRIRALYQQEGVSSILVIGGTGDYFDMSDTVLMMDCYKPHDVTKKAKSLAAAMPSIASSDDDAKTPKNLFKPVQKRKISSKSLRKILISGRGKVFAKVKNKIEVGGETIDVSAVAAIVEVSQSRAIAAALEKLGEMPELEEEGIVACIDKLVAEVERSGLDVLNCRGDRVGHYSQPRHFELHAALNRLRGLELGQ